MDIPLEPQPSLSTTGEGSPLDKPQSSWIAWYCRPVAPLFVLYLSFMAYTAADYLEETSVWEFLICRRRQ